MLLAVPLNSATTVTLRIKAVGYWEKTPDLALSLECGDPDEAQLVAALDISNEELLCQDANDPRGVE